MRVLSASAFLLVLGISVVSAQDSIQDLSPQACADLETELLAWKLSSAGENAKKNGFVPASSSGMSIMDVGDLQTEELQRLLNAKREIERIQQSQPQATFSLATPFALMTPAEYSAYLSRGLLPKRGVAATATPALNRTLHEETERRILAALPTSVDWQQYGCVTAVKDQGACNTCAAFATTASVESAICVKSGAAKTLVELSEQDQISCGAYEGNCLEGQFVQRALDWVQRLNGGSMCTKQSFPNTAATSTTCQRYLYESVTCAKPNAGIVAYDGAFQVPYNTAKFMEKVASQPLAVEINANLLQYYKSGVLMGNAATCGDPTNHAVLLVGYGEANGIKYWRAKNSWGPSWGEQGYFRIEQGYKGHPMGACLIEYSYHHPIVASDMPSVASRRISAWRQNVQQTGSLIDNTRSLDAYDCSEKCRVQDECKAFSYDVDAGMCQRLSAVGTDTPRSKHQSGRILTRTQTDAQCLVPEWHFDFPGNDIQTAQTTTHTDCCDLCNKVDNCHAYVWTKYHGGSCYLKTKKSRSDWKGANSDGSAYFIPAEVYKCQPLIQNTDLTGKDIGNAPASRAESCCAECRLVDGCTGFTWTNYNGGTCWLKSGALAQVANTGAMSGLV